ncbi:MAG: replicative DNA helicase [Acidobacteriota bacterium]
MNKSSDTSKLPGSDHAEKAVLGAMLIDNRYIDSVFNEINSDDFYRSSNKTIAAAIYNVYENGSKADTLTVGEHLGKDELKFVGGYAYLNSLTDGIPENFEISDYVDIVKDRSVLRRIISTSSEVISSGLEPKADVRSILAKLQDDIIKIAGAEIDDGFKSSDKIVPDTIKKIREIQKHGDSGGLKSGFYELDDMTGGFQSSDLIIIAARPSMGKTALGLNIASNIAIKGNKSVGFFSIEMSKLQIMLRMLATEAEVNMSALIRGKYNLTNQEWKKLELAAEALSKSKIHVDDSATLSILEMKTRARRLKRESGLDIIFVDYLQLMKVTGENLRRNDSRAQEVAIISASLKEMAKELQVPVVAMAQLNRSPEQRGTRRDGGIKYQLSDLKESGAIEQDADVIMFLHRDEQNEKETDRKGIADLIIAKQRNGPTGKIELAFQDKYTKFNNYDSSEEYF